MNTFTHRALFSILILASGLGLAGCPNLGMHTKIQTVTSQERISLKLPDDFLGKTIPVAESLGYGMQTMDPGKKMITFSRNPTGEEVTRAVLYGAVDKTEVHLVQTGPDTIEVTVVESGNFGKAKADSVRQAVETFKGALIKTFGPTTTAVVK